MVGDQIKRYHLDWITMDWKKYVWAFLIGLAVFSLYLIKVEVPGYMDGEYYYGMGLRIANGQGWSEPYIWNFLTDAEVVPHPGFTYWMPGPAFITALGIWITGLKSFSGGRAIHLLIAAILPALTIKVTYDLTRDKSTSLLAGLFAAFPAFYNIYLGTTDSFAITMLLGGIFYLISRSQENRVGYFGLGAIAGLMHLSRADGLIWIVAGAYCALKARKTKGIMLLLVFSGYLIVMAPWFGRNLAAIGQIMPSGVSRSFWLKEYNDLFSYPPNRLTFDSWFSQGIPAILENTLKALSANLKTALLVQGQIILGPFVVVGAWKKRSDTGVQAAFLVWLCILILMSVVFPFAGLRGGFLHSGAALQLLFWALAASGFFRAIEWGVEKRNWIKSKAGTVFGGALVVMVVLASVFVYYDRVIGENFDRPRWSDSYHETSQIATYLDDLGVGRSDLVLINNPPGLYAASGRQSVVIPNGGMDDLMLVGNKFGIEYLVLEKNHPDLLDDLYNHPDSVSNFEFVGDIGHAKIFRLEYQDMNEKP